MTVLVAESGPFRFQNTNFILCFYCKNIKRNSSEIAENSSTIINFFRKYLLAATFLDFRTGTVLNRIILRGTTFCDLATGILTIVEKVSLWEKI